MDHDQATRLRAAERYLLGELSDAERKEFEKHFFVCPACEEEVEAGIILEANARAVFAEQPDWSPVKPGLWDWFSLRPAFAGSLACLFVLLAGGLSYEAVVARGFRRELAELRAPQSYPSVFLGGVTRGAEQGAKKVIVPRESQFFGLSLDLPPGQSFGQYLGEIQNESGTVLFSASLPKPPTPHDPLHLLIHASSLEPGRRYTLVVRGLEEGSKGTRATQVARYDFGTQRN